MVDLALHPALVIPITRTAYARHTCGRVYWGERRAHVGALAWSQHCGPWHEKYGPLSRPWDAAGWRPA